MSSSSQAQVPGKHSWPGESTAKYSHKDGESQGLNPPLPLCLKTSNCLHKHLVCAGKADLTCRARLHEVSLQSLPTCQPRTICPQTSFRCLSLSIRSQSNICTCTRHEVPPWQKRGRTNSVLPFCLRAWEGSEPAARSGAAPRSAGCDAAPTHAQRQPSGFQKLAPDLPLQPGALAAEEVCRDSGGTCRDGAVRAGGSRSGCGRGEGFPCSSF